MFSINEAQLFCGIPFFFQELFYIYPLTLREVIDLDVKYEQYLSILIYPWQ